MVVVQWKAGRQVANVGAQAVRQAWGLSHLVCVQVSLHSSSAVIQLAWEGSCSSPNAPPPGRQAEERIQ